MRRRGKKPAPPVVSAAGGGSPAGHAAPAGESSPAGRGCRNTAGSRSGRGRRFGLLTTVLVAIGLGLVASGCGGDDEGSSAGGETVRLVVPAGAAQKVKRGEKVAGIPDRIEAQVGDTLVVVNHDDSTQYVSGFAVSPGQTMKIPLNRAGTYLTNCSAHRDRNIKMVVTEPGDEQAADAEAELFNSSGCAGCHRLDEAGAEGPMGPDLNRKSLTVEQVRETVENGSGAMPSYKGKLSPAEIERLADFVSQASSS